MNDLFFVKSLFSLLEPQKMAVISFGMEPCVIDAFTSQCGYTIGIETQSESRYQKALAQCGNRPHFESQCAIGLYAEIPLLQNLRRKVDLAYVDCNVATRRVICQYLMLNNLAHFIVACDADESIYKYDAIVMPPGWEASIISNTNGETLFFTCVEKISDDLFISARNEDTKGYTSGFENDDLSRIKYSK